MNRTLLIIFASAAMLSLAAPLLTSLTGVLNAGHARTPYVGADASGGSAGAGSSSSSGGGSGSRAGAGGGGF